MRVDKFLFCVRLFKTRSMAADACGKGRILGSETGVLPLHNSAMSVNDQRSIANQNMKINMGKPEFSWL